ncbi:MAG: flagellar basal-body protein FlbY [Asticcacaulis sp.]|nr:flagellar basal-body protein FlbY [Asticcacaulis sp.]
MALSAQNSSYRARQLLALTVRLGERLQHDTDVLEAHRPQDLAGEIAETQQLSNLYRLETARIKADPSLLGGLTAPEKQALREATATFQERLHRYEHAVNAAKTVTEGVIAAVAEDLNRLRNQAATYGALGKTSNTGPQSLNYGRTA